MMFCTPAPAGESRTLEAKIADLQRKIERLQEEARLNTQEAETSKQWIGELKPQIERLDIEIETASEELLLSEMEITSNNDALLEVLDHETRLRDQVDAQRTYLKARLGAVYRQGRYTALKLISNASTTEDFLRRLHYFGILARHDRERITELEGARRDLADALSRRKSIAAELLKLREEMVQRQQAVESKKQEKQDLLKRLAAHRSGFLLQSRELAATGRRLQKRLEHLQQVRLQDPETPFASFQGQLRWPVEGKLVSKFGRKRHEVYDAWTVENGITIAAEEGQPVRAVFRGRVRYAGRFHGYGKMVLLEHPGGYLTLYAHLETLEVLDGQDILEETILGTVGDTGVASEPTLYFELRQGLRPQNPLRWLRPQPRKARRT